MAQQRPVDRLGDEIGGPRGEGRLDGSQVVEARCHHDGNVPAVAALPDRAADRKAVEPRHLDVEEYEVGRLAPEGLERGQPFTQLGRSADAEEREREVVRRFRRVVRIREPLEDGPERLRRLAILTAIHQLARRAPERIGGVLRRPRRRHRDMEVTAEIQ